MDHSLCKLAWKIFPAKPEGQLFFSYYETNYYNLINTKYLNNSRRNSLHHFPFFWKYPKIFFPRTWTVARTVFAHSISTTIPFSVKSYTFLSNRTIFFTLIYKLSRNTFRNVLWSFFSVSFNAGYPATRDRSIFPDKKAFSTRDR